MRLVPVTRAEARKFVGQLHRHNDPPQGDIFRVGLQNGSDGLVGVAMAGRPVARALDDGRTVEVTRVCTDGTRNANSKLYGAVCRAAKALGYDRAVTYTLQSESGASLKATGWKVDDELPARGGWSNPSRPRYEEDIFGNDRTPKSQPKVRWVKQLR